MGEKHYKVYLPLMIFKTVIQNKVNCFSQQILFHMFSRFTYYLNV